METTEELTHFDINREDYINDDYYYNDVEFYTKFDKLIDEYEFLLEIDDYSGDIPTAPVLRYTTFKKSAAQYYFLMQLKEYNDLSLRGKDKNIVAYYYFECAKMINNPKFDKTDRGFHTLYFNAVKYITELITSNSKAITVPIEEAETYLYILHREGYFSLTSLPLDAFDINSPVNPCEIIGEVYAKYFLFKEFINDVFSTSILNEGEYSVVDIIKQKDKTKILPAENRKITEFINSDFKVKHDKIIILLSEKNPLHTVLKQKVGATSHEFLFSTHKMKIFQRKLVFGKGDNEIYVDRSYKSLKTVIIYLYTYLIKLNWFDLPHGTYTMYTEMLSNSFYDHTTNKKIELNATQFNRIVKKFRSSKPVPPNHAIYLDFVKLVVSYVNA